MFRYMKFSGITGWLMAVFTQRNLSVSGNRNVVKDCRDLKVFKKINIGLDHAEIYIQKGRSNKITIEAERNILSHIRSIVNKETLHIRLAPGLKLKPTVKLRLYIETPSFQELLNSSASDVLGAGIFSSEILQILNTGSGQITLSLQTDMLDVRNSGSGRVVLRGETDKMRCTSSGSGQVEAINLKTRKLFVNISGSGNGRFHCLNAMVGFISGSGDIYYNGSPKDIQIETTGNGSLIKNQYC